ncbi:MAG: large-conductance mechanosensitive channel protein MscL [Candidatus Fermentibacteraceae bacterium]
MGMMKEFKAFAMRGNVMDVAVGIIIGAAFGKIISSLVADLIMPTIGLLIGGVNFTDLSIVLREAAGETAAVTLNYGVFLQTLLDFVIVAFAIFMMVKGMNSLSRRKAQATTAPPAPSAEEVLLGEIRDILKQK